MATQNKKSSSGRGGKTTKKSHSSGKRTSGRNTHKEAQGPDLLTIVVVLIAVVLVLVLISKYKKEQEGGGILQPTGTVTGTSVPDTPAPGEAPGTPAPTQPATKAPDATATPEPPTPTEVPVLSQTEAQKLVTDIVQLDKYTIELLDDHLMIDGTEYYSFCINDENGVALEPLVIVEKREGKLLCYDLSGVVAPIAKFPLDKTEKGEDSVKSLTAEEALEVIKGYSGQRLGLTKDTSGYEMTMDEWTTMAEGVTCYGVNFFETVDGKQRFRGTFYVALDGSAVYSKDDVTGEFIKR